MGVNPDNKSCYSMSSSNSEGIKQQNDSMAKEICGLVKEHNNVLVKAQPAKKVMDHNEKKNSLYPDVFGITDYLTSACHWSLVNVTQRMVFTVLGKQ